MNLTAQVTPPADMKRAALLSFQQVYPDDPELAQAQFDALMAQTGGADPTSDQLCEAVERERAKLSH